MEKVEDVLEIHQTTLKQLRALSKMNLTMEQGDQMHRTFAKHEKSTMFDKEACLYEKILPSKPGPRQ